jgi:short-subunit dehydrogenase
LRKDELYFCFIGSSSGITGIPRFSAYSASKAALHAYFFSTIGEDTVHRIDVLGLIPSGMKTNFQKTNGVPSSGLDKILLTSPDKVADDMINWMESRKRKSQIRYLGLSSKIFLVLRNLPFKIQANVVKKLSEGNR